MVSSARTTKLPYYKLRADSSRIFTGLCVRQAQQFPKAGTPGLKRGWIACEPIAIPRKTPEVLVEWFIYGVKAKPVSVSLSRIELSGPDRLKSAAPQLTDDQLVWIAGTAKWEVENWITLDEVADKWAKGDLLPKLEVPGMDVHELKVDGALSDLQRALIADQARKVDALVSSKDLAERWLKLGQQPRQNG